MTKPILLSIARQTNTTPIFKATASTQSEANQLILDACRWAKTNRENVYITIQRADGSVHSTACYGK